MRVIVFGASGMVGQGVLRECLLDPGVESVLTVGRSPLTPELKWPGLGAGTKLRDLVVPDLMDYSAVEDDLRGYDACFFTLGVSSAGMKEDDYRRITYDLTLAAAEMLARLNPAMTFVYVSGAGTDSTERGKVMWARVKGATENELLRLGFKGAYMFRPGLIMPMDGIRSKTKAYRLTYAAIGWMLPLVRKGFPKWITSTRDVGRGMLLVAREGYPLPVLEAADIAAL